MATSRIMSRRDLEFLLYEWLDAEALTRRPRYAEHDRDTFDAVLDLSEQIAGDFFAPLNQSTDAAEPYVGDDGRVVLPPEVARALAAYTDSGLPASVFDTELGGLQLPFVVHQAGSAFFQAAASAPSPTRSSRRATPTCSSRTARPSRSGCTPRR